MQQCLGFPIIDGWYIRYLDVKLNGIQPGGHEYCSMANDESAAALSDGVVLLEALDIAEDVLTWTLSNFVRTTDDCRMRAVLQNVFAQLE